MAERLPAVAPFASTINDTKLAKKTRVRDSTGFLLSNQVELASFATVDDLAIEAYDDPKSNAERFVWHLTEIRRVLARVLWARQIFVGLSVLDEILFYEFTRSGATDPILGVLERIRDARIARPGLILFPLHSFGIYSAGIVHSFTEHRITAIDATWGIAVTPQTNNLDLTLQFLEDARKEFGIPERLPYELIEHWRRSRPTEWLERNPLLAVRALHAPGGYYENEFLILARVRAAATLLAMLATFQSAERSRGEVLFSSSSVNNFQTLDIHHYIVLYSKPGKKAELAGDCVPVHGSRPAVVETTDLNIDLDATFWTTRRRGTADRVEWAVGTVYTGLLRYSIGGIDDARARTHRKLFESMAYFKRSFSTSEREWRETVSLATAFEMMLTDGYQSGVTKRLERRVQLLLKGVRGTTKYQAAVRELYEARSQIVHLGNRNVTVDLNTARHAYVLAFCALADRLSAIKPKSATPLQDLIGDTS